MRRFIARFLDRITGVIEGFDRIVFRGWFGKFCHEGGMYSFLANRGVLLKDFELFAKGMTEALRREAESQAAKLGDKVRYLTSSDASKEEIARKLFQERGNRTGPIGIFSAVEPCSTWEVRRSRTHQHPQEFRRKSAKCLHDYHYRFHPRFGFMHVRVQTWFPFQIRVCMNGREWLGRQLDRHRMRYERADNCFPWLASPERAQELMDEFLDLRWPEILDDLAFAANPALAAIAAQLGHGPYWTVWQSEWATDVMFKDRESLQECFPSFVRFATENLHSPSVTRFLGRKLVGQFRGEVKTHFHERIEGTCVRHSVDANSLKFYSKFGTVLRPEATINQPSDFKVRRRVQGDPTSLPKLRPLRRTVADIKRLAAVGKGCTHRYLDALATVAVDTPLGKVVEPLTHPAELKGRRVRGLRPWTEPDIQLLEAIGSGEYIANGFRNRDLLPRLFPAAPKDAAQRRRLSAKVTRLLRLLRAHGLIEKVRRTHRYLVTEKGRTAIAALLAARNAPLSTFQKCA